MRALPLTSLLCCLLALSGCPGPSTPGGDAGSDAGGGSDGAVDAGDAGRDGATDAATGPDTGVDAATGGDGGGDAGNDTGVGSDAGIDAGRDAGLDAGRDAASSADVGTDTNSDGGTPSDVGNDAYAPACRNSVLDDGELCFFNSTIVATVNDFVSTDVQVADLNVDNRLDVVFTDDSNATGYLASLVQQPGGTFTRGMLDITVGPVDVAVGDLNGDGAVDAITGHSRTSALVSARGLNTGLFSLTRTYTLSDLPATVALAHFDSNATLDYVATTQRNFVRVASGMGDGMFATPIEVPVNGVPLRVVAAELSPDGLTDLAVAVVASGGTGEVDLVARMGDLSFVAPIPFAIPGTAGAIAAADLNLDGRADVVVGGTNGVQVLASTSSGWTLQAPFDVSSFSALEIEIADLDRDGDLDVVAGGVVSGGGGELRIYRNQGAGTFGAASTIPVAAPPRRIAIGDLNRDGALDLVLALFGTGGHGVAFAYQEP